MIKRINRLAVLITLSLSALNVQATEMPEKPDKAIQAMQESIAVTHPCARMSVSRLDKRASPFQTAIDEYSEKYQVDSSIIKAVIAIESCFKERAESHAGAQGLMQLIPATAERFGVTDSFDSTQNIQGGTRYLSWLIKRFKGDLVKVFAAYNAGEGKVDRYDGVPPYKETRHYVHNVMAVYRKLSDDKSPSDSVSVDKALADAATPDVVPSVDLSAFAKAIPAIATRTAITSAPAPIVTARRAVAVSKPTTIPAVVKALSETERLRQQGIVIGGPGVPVKPPPIVEEVVQAVVKPVAVAPVQIAQVASRPAQPAKRVSVVFESPFKKLPPSKPGRAGWQINKAMAPQLYKQ